MALTESWLKAQYGKSKTKELVKADRDGLCARVSPKGKVTYSLLEQVSGFLLTHHKLPISGHF